MTIEEIRELIQVVNESGIAELEVQRGDNRVRIRRTQRHHVGFTTSEVQPAVSTPPPAPPPPAPAAAAPPPPAASDNEHLVKSPIVGTFYESSAPTRPSASGRPRAPRVIWTFRL